MKRVFGETKIAKLQYNDQKTPTYKKKLNGLYRAVDIYMMFDIYLSGKTWR